MISNNIVGYCFSDRKIDITSPFDIGEFFTRILLFDKVFLKSARLNDIGYLTKAIGAEQTIELIESGSLNLIIDSLNLAATGQNTILKSGKERGGPLPLGSYSFHVINVCFKKDKMREILSNVRPKDHYIKKTIFKKLKLSVANSIIESPDQLRYSSMAAIINDLENNIDAIPYLITRKLNEKKGIRRVSATDIKVITHQLSEKDFKVETNLNSLFGFNIKEEHKIVQSALLALGSFNQMLLEMEAFDSITVFDDDDYSLFDQKYKFLSKNILKQELQSQMSRVVQLNDLPDFSQIGSKHTINITKLLKIKKSEEFLLFREFLKSSENLSDKELLKIFKSIKVKLSQASNSPLGKTARLLFGAGIGLIPIAGPPLGLAVSAADQYLFEKVMPSKGVISFISRGYPSIFNEKNC